MADAKGMSVRDNEVETETEDQGLQVLTDHSMDGLRKAGSHLRIVIRGMV